MLKIIVLFAVLSCSTATYYKGNFRRFGRMGSIGNMYGRGKGAYMYKSKHLNNGMVNAFQGYNGGQKKRGISDRFNDGGYPKGGLSKHMRGRDAGYPKGHLSGFGMDAGYPKGQLSGFGMDAGYPKGQQSGFGMDAGYPKGQHSGFGMEAGFPKGQQSPFNLKGLHSGLDTDRVFGSKMDSQFAGLQGSMDIGFNGFGNNFEGGLVDRGIARGAGILGGNMHASGFGEWNSLANANLNMGNMDRFGNGDFGPFDGNFGL